MFIRVKKNGFNAYTGGADIIINTDMIVSISINKQNNKYQINLADGPNSSFFVDAEDARRIFEAIGMQV